MHIRQGSKGGTWLSAEANVTDGAGSSLASSENDDMRIGVSDESLTVKSEDSELPWDVEIQFPRKYSDEYHDWNTDFDLVTEITVGDTSWDSDDRDESKLPNCGVGGWDHEAFSNRGVLDVAQPAWRDMDCRFAC